MKEVDEDDKKKIEIKEKKKKRIIYAKNFNITKITPDFYKKIIELENKIQLSLRPDMEDIKQLGSLYKKGIEAFCMTSS